MYCKHGILIFKCSWCSGIHGQFTYNDWHTIDEISLLNDSQGTDANYILDLGTRLKEVAEKMIKFAEEKITEGKEK